jgi:hypothetical protein
LIAPVAPTEWGRGDRILYIHDIKVSLMLIVNLLIMTYNKYCRSAEYLTFRTSTLITKYCSVFVYITFLTS